MLLHTLLLFVAVFVTSIFGIIVGGNTFINVPAMIFLLGLPIKQAIALNMFGLIFLSLGGGIKFYTVRKLNLKLLAVLWVITLISSYIGAKLVLQISDLLLRRIISITMISFCVFMLSHGKAGQNETPVPVSALRKSLGYIATFVLGIYGGFLSAGYVTMLTLSYVTLFGMSFLEAVSITKLINLVSSLIAVVVFISNGMIDYKLALPLSACMMVGGWIGASIAIEKGNRWVRGVFIVAIVILAIKLLFF